MSQLNDPKCNTMSGLNTVKGVPLRIVTEPSSNQLHQEKFTFECHPDSSGSSVRVVQFVVDPSGTLSQASPAKCAPNPFGSTERSEVDQDSRCTLCGKKFVDRVDFNAHIRMHLKEKLNTRREQKQLKEENESPAKLVAFEQVPTPTSLCSPSPKSFPSLLPSSPLPLNKVETVSHMATEKPNLNSLVHQISAKQITPSVVNLQAPQRTQLDFALLSNSIPSPRPSSTLPSPAPSSTTSSSSSSEMSLAMSHSETTEVSDEELMPYEMDFQNDITSILDQLERDFESSPCGSMILGNVRLDTPPDSDSENSDYLNRFLEDEPCFPPHSRFLSGCCDPMVRCKEEPFDNEPEPTVACVNFDLLNVEKAPRKILTPPQTSLLQRQIKVEPSSLLACRVERPPGQGPQRQPETSGVKRPSSTNLDQLMKSKSISQVAKRQVQTSVNFESKHKESSTKFLSSSYQGQRTTNSGSDTTRVIDVVKVERSNSCALGPLPAFGHPYAIINIECRQAGDAGQGLGKLIETYRAIDTGTEIKLLMGNGSMLNDITLDKSSWSIKTKSDTQMSSSTPANPPIPNLPKSLPKSKMSSECSVCGKVITTKNMARHMEKHIGKKKFECNVCSATFTQKMHLKNHVILHVTKSKPVESQVKKAPDTKQTAVRSFSCPSCSRSFVQKGHLNRHIRTVHEENGETTRPSESIEALTCRVCQRVCKSKSSLIKHRAKHFACVRCTEIFQNKVSLQDHLLKVHPDSAIVTVERPDSQPSPFLEVALNNSYDEFLDPVIGSVRSPSAFVSDLSTIGESLANIADTNFFDSPEDIHDDFYHSDLF